MNLTPDRYMTNDGVRRAMMTTGALAPAALMYATRDKEAQAYAYGRKLAALDVSKLPQGVSLPSPYEAQWSTPSGHSVKHPVRSEVVDHGIATNPAYYDELSKEIGRRSELVEKQAPHDIAEDVSFRRGANTVGGGALGGLAGAGLGAGAGAIAHLLRNKTHGFSGKTGPGLGQLAATGGLIGSGLGGIAGMVMGARKKVKPLDHMEYGDDEDGSSVPGGPIKQLHQESPEERRMKAMQEDLDDTRYEMESHGWNARPYGRYTYDPYYGF